MPPLMARRDEGKIEAPNGFNSTSPIYNEGEEGEGVRKEGSVEDSGKDRLERKPINRPE